MQEGQRYTLNKLPLGSFFKRKYKKDSIYHKVNQSEYPLRLKDNSRNVFVASNTVVEFHYPEFFNNFQLLRDVLNDYCVFDNYKTISTSNVHYKYEYNQCVLRLETFRFRITHRYNEHSDIYYSLEGLSDEDYLNNLASLIKQSVIRLTPNDE